MGKVTIEFEDHEGQVAVQTTISEFSEDSKACQMAARVAEFVERIADAADAPTIREYTPAMRDANGHRLQRKSSIVLAS